MRDEGGCVATLTMIVYHTVTGMFLATDIKHVAVEFSDGDNPLETCDDSINVRDVGL